MRLYLHEMAPIVIAGSTMTGPALPATAQSVPQTSGSKGTGVRAASHAEGGKSQSIQALRGLATLGVAFYHSHTLLLNPGMAASM